MEEDKKYAERLITLVALILTNVFLLALYEFEKSFTHAQMLFLISWVNIFAGSFGFAYGVKIRRDMLILLLSIFLIILAIIIDIRILFTLENFSHIFTVSNLVSEVIMAFTIPRLLLEEERYDLEKERFEWEKKKLAFQFLPEEKKREWAEKLWSE